MNTLPFPSSSPWFFFPFTVHHVLKYYVNSINIHWINDRSIRSLSLFPTNKILLLLHTYINFSMTQIRKQTSVAFKFDACN